MSGKLIIEVDMNDDVSIGKGINVLQSLSQSAPVAQTVAATTVVEKTPPPPPPPAAAAPTEETTTPPTVVGSTVGKGGWDLNALDKNGVPWDARIHSGNQKRTDKGYWQKRKGVDQIRFDTVIAELKGEVVDKDANGVPWSPAVNTQCKGKDENGFWLTLEGVTQAQKDQNFQQVKGWLPDVTAEDLYDHVAKNLGDGLISVEQITAELQRISLDERVQTARNGKPVTLLNELEGVPQDIIDDLWSTLVDDPREEPEPSSAPINPMG